MCRPICLGVPFVPLTPKKRRTVLPDGPSLVCVVELRGLEPLTPCMPCRCATSCATAPYIDPRLVFPGSNLNSVMHNPAGCEIEGPQLSRRRCWRDIPPAVDSLEPKLRNSSMALRSMLEYS